MKIKSVSFLDDSSFDEIIDIYKNDGIVLVKNIVFNNDINEYSSLYPNNTHRYDVLPKSIDQLSFTKKLGDGLGWFPNSTSSFWDHIIVENHGRTDLSQFSDKDLIICWHLEHVDYDIYNPLLASVWSMWHCELDANGNAGNTFFVDSQKVYDLLDEDEKSFISKCFLSWYDIDNSGPHEGSAVVNHWLTNKPIIRIEITPSVVTDLKLFSGRSPRDDEIKRFNSIKSKIMSIIENNTDIRMVHSWQKNDIIVVDLQRMAHTVTGGFKSKDRMFTNFFAYLKNPYDMEEQEKPLIWREEWIKNQNNFDIM